MVAFLRVVAAWPPDRAEVLLGDPLERALPDPLERALRGPLEGVLLDPLEREEPPAPAREDSLPLPLAREEPVGPAVREALPERDAARLDVPLPSLLCLPAALALCPRVPLAGCLPRLSVAAFDEVRPRRPAELEEPRSSAMDMSFSSYSSSPSRTRRGARKRSEGGVTQRHRNQSSAALRCDSQR